MGGNGCPVCGLTRHTTETFVQKSREKHVWEGLKSVFRHFDAGGSYISAANKSHGAANEIHLIHYLTKMNIGEIKKIRSDRHVSTKYDPKGLGKREGDVIIELNGDEIIIDSKAWGPDKIEKRIRKYLEKSGQLYRDIASMLLEGKNVRWAFDKRCVNWTAPDGKGIDKKLPEWILDHLEYGDNGNVKNKLMNDMEIDKNMWKAKKVHGGKYGYEEVNLNFILTGRLLE